MSQKSPNVEIFPEPVKVASVYKTGPIARIDEEYVVDNGSWVTVSFRNGEVYKWHCKYLSCYTMQMGVSVSRDGSKVFVQTWEMGILCYDSRTGERLWKTRSRRGVTTVVVNEKTLCCHRHDYSLELIDIETGEVLREKRPAKSWGADILDEHHILCQVTAKRWEIIRTDDLEVVDTFAHKPLFSQIEEKLKPCTPGGDGDWCYRGTDYDGSHLLIDMFRPVRPDRMEPLSKTVEVPYTIPDEK